jgi:ferrous iron transport protein A
MHLKYQPTGIKQRAQDAERTRGAARASDAGFKAMTLGDLKTGETARVVSVAPADGEAAAELERRLAELGFLPGEAVRIVARGLLSREPIAVRVGTGTFALRSFEAACIHVCPERFPAV